MLQSDLPNFPNLRRKIRIPTLHFIIIYFNSTLVSLAIFEGSKFCHRLIHLRTSILVSFFFFWFSLIFRYSHLLYGPIQKQNISVRWHRLNKMYLEVLQLKNNLDHKELYKDISNHPFKSKPETYWNSAAKICKQAYLQAEAPPTLGTCPWPTKENKLKTDTSSSPFLQLPMDAHPTQWAIQEKLSSSGEGRGGGLTHLRKQSVCPSASFPTVTLTRHGGRNHSKRW